LDFLITGGQVNDCTQAIELLGQYKAEAVLADKGFDADAIVEHVEAMGAKAVISPKRYRKVQRKYDKYLYKQRNRIERCFSKLKCFRRFATRYEKSKNCFHALVALACAWLHLRLYVDTAWHDEPRSTLWKTMLPNESTIHPVSKRNGFIIFKPARYSSLSACNGIGRIGVPGQDTSSYVR
jgi:transposase